jgi:hypothetical protein
VNLKATVKRDPSTMTDAQLPGRAVAVGMATEVEAAPVVLRFGRCLNVRRAGWRPALSD